MKIAVAGVGYVGLANAVLLAQHYDVIAYDINQDRINLLNSKKAPIVDAAIQEYLESKPLKLTGTIDKVEAFSTADFVIVATPTDYDTITGQFDTSSVEAIINDVRAVNTDAAIIIKSTIPIGFTAKMKQVHQDNKIIFSPEFLREGNALNDLLNPSRIIVGADCVLARQFADMMKSSALKEDPLVLFTGSNEAEAIKLFANTYLATRIAYFNELDSFAIKYNLDAKQMIEGVCSDERIGFHYNNPSFGYGGYCLPKDTKQLLANFEGVPQNLFDAVVKANQTRKEFIAANILDAKPKTVGVYRLAMKADSDNYRESAILDIISIIRSAGTEVIVYDPSVKLSTIFGVEIVNDLETFKKRSDVIIANRISSEISDVPEKLYTRDIYRRD